MVLYEELKSATSEEDVKDLYIKALLFKAISLSGQNSDEETVNQALSEFIERRGAERVIEMFGTMEYDDDYDYKTARR